MTYKTRRREDMNRGAMLLSMVAFYTFLVIPMMPLWAQDVTLPEDADISAPNIQHEPSQESVGAGESLEIMAIITDDEGVKEATLYYRSVGNVEYFSLKMTPLEGDAYTAIIPREDVLEPGMEYYVQASDKAGNVVLRGFSFEPLVVTVAPVLPTMEFPPSEDLVLKTEGPPSKPWYKKWWVWTIVGAVAIGGAVAASGGGGGGGDGSTGSATITAPVP